MNKQGHKGGIANFLRHGSDHMARIGKYGGKQGKGIPKDRSSTHSVAMYSLAGRHIRTYPTIAMASKATKVQGSNIRHCADGRRKSAGGYRWQYVEGGSNAV